MIVITDHVWCGLRAVRMRTDPSGGGHQCECRILRIDEATDATVVGIMRGGEDVPTQFAYPFDQCVDVVHVDVCFPVRGDGDGRGVEHAAYPGPCMLDGQYPCCEAALPSMSPAATSEPVREEKLHANVAA